MDSKAALQDRFAIQERFRNQTAGFPIYNGSDVIQRLQYAAERYTLMPDAQALDPKTGKMAEFDGVTLIHDIYRPDPEALRTWRTRVSNGEATNRDAPKATFRSATAGEIIAHIAAKHRDKGITELAIADIFDENGVVIRTMAEENERLKKLARVVYIKTRKESCDLILKRYRTRTAGMDLGDPEKFFNNEEVAAEKWLTAYEAGKSERTKFPCSFGCGFWSHAEEDLTQHYDVRHKEAEPVKRGPGRPKKEVAA